VRYHAHIYFVPLHQTRWRHAGSNIKTNWTNDINLGTGRKALNMYGNLTI
jgi:hypothetical protein